MFVKLTDYKFRVIESAAPLSYYCILAQKSRARDGYAPEANCLMRQSRSGCCPDRAHRLIKYNNKIGAPHIKISSLKTRPTPVPYFCP